MAVVVAYDEVCRGVCVAAAFSSHLEDIGAGHVRVHLVRDRRARRAPLARFERVCRCLGAALWESLCVCGSLSVDVCDWCDTVQRLVHPVELEARLDDPLLLGARVCVQSGYTLVDIKRHSNSKFNVAVLYGVEGGVMEVDAALIVGTGDGVVCEYLNPTSFEVFVSSDSKEGRSFLMDTTTVGDESRVEVEREDAARCYVKRQELVRVLHLESVVSVGDAIFEACDLPDARATCVRAGKHLLIRCSLDDVHFGAPCSTHSDGELLEVLRERLPQVADVLSEQALDDEAPRPLPRRRVMYERVSPIAKLLSGLYLKTFVTYIYKFVSVNSTKALARELKKRSARAMVASASSLSFSQKIALLTSAAYLIRDSLVKRKKALLAIRAASIAALWRVFVFAWYAVGAKIISEAITLFSSKTQTDDKAETAAALSARLARKSVPFSRETQLVRVAHVWSKGVVCVGAVQPEHEDCCARGVASVARSASALLCSLSLENALEVLDDEEARDIREVCMRIDSALIKYAAESE